ncbi:MAG: DUF2207 family protein [Lactobacillus gallinarum]|uniref:DUF2207 family protein n=1 Tax=Lactobacillus gallinarum TaxID=52242 RepID=UPI00382CAF65
MKKKLLNLIGILSLISIFVIWTQPVKADVDYDITDMNVTAKVNRDGSVMIHRKIYYDFDSDAHGVFYRQNLTQKQQIKDIQVKVNNQPVVAANNEKNNTYQLTKKDNSYRFKVFHRISEDSRIKVEYSYKILNLITNYKDAAELNFKIIGNGWDTDIDHAQATVVFPEPVKGLKAWAHGSLDGYTQVLPQKGKVIMKADGVAGDVGIEVHAIFPTAVTAANKNFVDQNKKAAIEKQEAQLAKEANERRKRKSYFGWGLAFVSLISGLAVIIKGFFDKKLGFKPKKERDLAHNYEIPNVDPVTAQVLDNAAWPDTKAFTAYLMQLAGKKKIKIEEFKTKHLKKTNYRISVVDESILDDDLLYFLFKQVGDGKSFTTKGLRNYTSRKLGKKFDSWCKKRYKQTEKDGFLDHGLKMVRSHYRSLAIIGIMISIAAWAIAIFQLGSSTASVVGGGILLIIIEFIAFFIGNNKISLYTKKGALETDQVRGFEKMLDDIGKFKMKDVGDLILWEDIMPYAVAFGLSKKVLKQLRLEFSEDELNATGFIVGSSFYSTGSDGFERNFTSSFSEGVSYGSSSSSGGSGGFSGGSSGGVGGGSGGGAF